MNSVTITVLSLRGELAQVEYKMDGMSLGTDSLSFLTLAIVTGCWEAASGMVGRTFGREVA